jgi:hypothetical protein
MYVHLEPIGLNPLPSLSEFQFIPLRNCSERSESLASPKESPTIAQSGFDEEANSSSGFELREKTFYASNH